MSKCQEKKQYHSAQDLSSTSLYCSITDNQKFLDYGQGSSFITRSQKMLLLWSFLILIVACFYEMHFVLSVFFCIVNIIYFSASAFKLFLFGVGLNAKNKYKNRIITVTEDLPLYSIIVPLHKEAEALQNLVENLTVMHYPKSKLQILMVMEEEDQETILAYDSLDIPTNFHKVLVPSVGIKTKPKACNYALNFAIGEYICIYDAEDAPHPDQLLCVIERFRHGNDRLACIQARLGYYNADDNILTQMFAIEYSALFEYILPALERFNTLIPLGGTSNHFKASVLKQLGWDASNLTEDAEISVRMKKHDYEIALIVSYTLEESPITLKAWIKQRTRWTKGFIQTYFLHIRAPRELYSKLQAVGIMTFHVFFIFSPLSAIGAVVHIVFLTVIEDYFFGKVFLFNCAFFILSSALQAFYILNKKSPKICAAVKSFIYPLYLKMQSIAACRAILQLMQNQYHWEKTTHGVSKIKNFAWRAVDK